MTGPRALALITIAAAGCGDKFEPGTEQTRSPRCTLAGAYQLTFTSDGGAQAIAFTLPDPMTRFRPSKRHDAAYNRRAADAWFASAWIGMPTGPMPALLDVPDDPLLIVRPDHKACTVEVSADDHGTGFTLELRVDGTAPGVTGRLTSTQPIGPFEVTGTRQPLPPERPPR